MKNLTIGLFALVLLAPATTHATALPLAVVPPDGCPSQAALSAELTRLLPTPPPSASAVDVLVVDRGERFDVDIAGAIRSFAEPLRDCEERAHTAAIVIAVTLAPPAIAYGDAACECDTTAPASSPTRAATLPTTTGVQTRAPAPAATTNGNGSHFLFALDASSGYENVASTSNFGSGVLALQLGASFDRWTLAGRGLMRIGYGGPSFDQALHIEGTVGGIAMVKVGSRLRVGLAVGVGFGIGNLAVPAAAQTDWSGTATLASGWQLSAEGEVTYDIERNRARTKALYLVASVGVTGWLGVDELFVDHPPATAAELNFRLGLGYRFGR